MGYMTTIMILNDCWDQIEKNPEKFIENIRNGMDGIDEYNRMGRKFINNYSIGNCGNSIDIAMSHHADDFRLYLVGQNMMTTFGYANDDIKDLELKKELLETAKWIIKDEENRIKKLEKEINNNKGVD